jgi:hypothetical protein
MCTSHTCTPNVTRAVTRALITAAVITGADAAVDKCTFKRRLAVAAAATVDAAVEGDVDAEE